MKSKKKSNSLFEKFANGATKFTGSSPAFIGALSIVVLWAVTGPVFKYSETWQLVINTGTTIITFLMVFLIQKAQNKDGKAIQLKLNELIAAQEFTSNRMVDIEDLSEDELDQLHKYYVKLAALAKRENNFHISHSIDAAESWSERKSKNIKQQKKSIKDGSTTGTKGNN